MEQTPTYAGVSQAPECQRSVHVELRQATDLDGNNPVILPEAQHVAPARWVCVTLPSGKLLACRGSVFIEYCSAFERMGEDHFLNLIDLDYRPNRQAWSDKEVICYFSALHQYSLLETTILNLVAQPAWLPLSEALGVEFFTDPTQRSEMLQQLATNFDRVFSWLGFFVKSEEWRQEWLEHLLQLTPAHFRQLSDPRFAEQVVRLFPASEIAELAFSRWKYWGQGWKANPRLLIGLSTEDNCRTTSVYPKIVEQYDEINSCILVKSRTHYNGFVKEFTFWQPLAKVSVERHSQGAFIRFGTPTVACEWQRSDKLERIFQRIVKHGQSVAECTVASQLEPNSGAVALVHQRMPEPHRKLPRCMLLRVVVNEYLSIDCNCDAMETMSRFVSEVTSVDQSNELHLPFAASFRPEEVVKFFEWLHSKRPLSDEWYLSWVHLADYLQLEATWLDQIRERLWNSVQFDALADWVAATRLPSMQQRKPENAPATLTDSDAAALLLRVTCHTLTQALEKDAQRFISVFGVRVLWEVLAQKELPLVHEPRSGFSRIAVA